MKILPRKPLLIAIALVALLTTSSVTALTVAPKLKQASQVKLQNDQAANKFGTNMASRSERKLDRNNFFTGINLGIAGLGGGVALALKNRQVQKEKIKAMTKSIQSQMNQFFVLNHKNQEFYHQMDEHLTELEEKLEDFCDSSAQRISEFDMRIRQKLRGAPFMPLLNYL